MELTEVNVILGMGWLSACKGVIKYAQCTVLLITPSGEWIEYEGIQAPLEDFQDETLEGGYIEDGKDDCEFLDINAEGQALLDGVNTTDDYTYDDYPIRILEIA